MFNDHSSNAALFLENIVFNDITLHEKKAYGASIKDNFFPSTIFSTHLSLLTYIMDLDAGTEP